MNNFSSGLQAGQALGGAIKSSMEPAKPSVEEAVQAGMELIQSGQDPMMVIQDLQQSNPEAAKQLMSMLGGGQQQVMQPGLQAQPQQQGGFGDGVQTGQALGNMIKGMF